MCGMIIGALVPFMTQRLSGAPVALAEMRDGYGAFAVLVHAAYGALSGWAVGALVLHYRRPRQ